MSVPTINPFPGSSPLPCDGRVGGRETAKELLEDYIYNFRVVLLHGPSGAGKSSLINAGFLPACAASFGDILRFEPAQPGTEATPQPSQILQYTSGWQPLNPVRVRNILAPWAGASSADGSERPLAWLSRFSIQHFQRAGDPTVAPHTAPPLLIFDSFEVMLTRHQDEIRDFFQQLEALLSATHMPDASLQDGIGRHEVGVMIYALFVVRGSYLGHLEPWRRWLPGNLRSSVDLQRMNRSEATQAISARNESVQPPRLTPADIDSVVTYLEGKKSDASAPAISEPDDEGAGIEPLYLSLICKELWDAREKERASAAEAAEAAQAALSKPPEAREASEENAELQAPAEPTPAMPYAMEAYGEKNYEAWLSDYVGRTIDEAVAGELSAVTNPSFAEALKRGLRLWMHSSLTGHAGKNADETRPLGNVGDEAWKNCLLSPASKEDDPLSKAGKRLLPILERMGLIGRLKAGDQTYWQLAHRRLNGLLLASNKKYFESDALLPWLETYALEQQVPYWMAQRVTWYICKRRVEPWLQRLSIGPKKVPPIFLDHMLAVERKYIDISLKIVLRPFWTMLAIFVLSIVVGVITSEVALRNAQIAASKKIGDVEKAANKKTGDVEAAANKKIGDVEAAAEAKTKVLREDTEKLKIQLEENDGMRRRFILDPNIRITDRFRVFNLFSNREATELAPSEKELRFRFDQQTSGLLPASQNELPELSSPSLKGLGAAGHLATFYGDNILVYPITGPAKEPLWKHAVGKVPPIKLAVSPSGNNVFLVDVEGCKWIRREEDVSSLVRVPGFNLSQLVLADFINEKEVILVNDEQILKISRTVSGYEHAILGTLGVKKEGAPPDRCYFKEERAGEGADSRNFLGAALVSRPPDPSAAAGSARGPVLCLIVKNAFKDYKTTTRNLCWLPTDGDHSRETPVDTGNFKPDELRQISEPLPESTTGMTRTGLALLGTLTPAPTTGKAKKGDPKALAINPQSHEANVPDLVIRWWHFGEPKVGDERQIFFSGDSDLWRPTLLFASHDIVGVQWPRNEVQFAHVSSLPSVTRKEKEDRRESSGGLGFVWSAGSSFYLADPPPALVSEPNNEGEIIIGSRNSGFYRYNPTRALPFRTPPPALKPPELSKPNDLLVFEDAYPKDKTLKGKSDDDLTLPKPTGKAVISPDGNFFAIADRFTMPGPDGSKWSHVRLFDLRTGTERTTLEQKIWEDDQGLHVRALGFDQTSRWLLAGGDNGKLHLFRLPEKDSEPVKFYRFPLYVSENIEKNDYARSIYVETPKETVRDELLIIAGMKSGRIERATFKLGASLNDPKGTPRTSTETIFEFVPGASLEPLAAVAPADPPPVAEGAATATPNERPAAARKEVAILRILPFTRDARSHALVLAADNVLLLQFPTDSLWPENRPTGQVKEITINRGLKAQLIAVARDGKSFAVTKDQNGIVEHWAFLKENKEAGTIEAKIIDQYVYVGNRADAAPTAVTLVSTNASDRCVRVVSGNAMGEIKMAGPQFAKAREPRISDPYPAGADFAPMPLYNHPPMLSPRTRLRQVAPQFPIVLDIAGGAEGEVMTAILYPGPNGRRFFVQRTQLPDLHLIPHSATGDTGAPAPAPVP